MTFLELVKHLRETPEPLVVRDIVILAGTEQFEATGRIRVRNRQMFLEVFLEGEKRLPKAHGSFSAEQFWMIAGVIENHVPFWTRSIPRSWKERHIQFQVRSAEFRVDRINHLPDLASDTQSLIEQATKAYKIAKSDLATDSAFARIPDYKIFGEEESERRYRNAFLRDTTENDTDTIVGTSEKFEFALIQDGVDCNVHVRLTDGEKADPGEVQTFLDVLLKSIAFLLGQNSWPCHYQLLNGLNTVQEWATAGLSAPRMHDPLLRETTAIRGTSISKMLPSVIRCLQEPGKFTTSLNRLMFLAREGGAKTMPHATGALGLCAVFEGLVDLLAEKFLTSPEKAKSDAAFKAAQKLVRADMDARIEAAADPIEKMNLERIRNKVASASSLRPEDSFRELMEFFKVPSSKFLGEVLQTWKRQRNVRAHGKSKDVKVGDLEDVSRISGGINLLAACAVGYPGPIPVSAVEERYIRLASSLMR